MSEAKKLCPDVVIIKGEDLTPFREASKDLFRFLAAFAWNGKCERLGFDECWMDISDIITHNVQHFNAGDPRNSFFRLNRNRPESGFRYDASSFLGNIFPAEDVKCTASNLSPCVKETSLELRLKLGSHLAQHMRQLMLRDKGFTATVGISTNKLLSKLVGNVCKPDGQTTLIPPYQRDLVHGESNVSRFLDAHEIGQIPGIGFKASNALKRELLGRDPAFSEGLVYGRPLDFVSVGQVRRELSFKKIVKAASGPGSRRALTSDVFNWIHGRDDAEVRDITIFPTQISMEDSYLQLNTEKKVQEELFALSKKLISRMRLDLAQTPRSSAPLDKVSPSTASSAYVAFRWLAVPRALRLSTRPRMSVGADSGPQRSFRRISRRTALPSFILQPGDVDNMAQRLVTGSLLPLFRQIHPETSRWCLSLINVAGRPELSQQRSL